MLLYYSQSNFDFIASWCRERWHFRCFAKKGTPRHITIPVNRKSPEATKKIYRSETCFPSAILLDRSLMAPFSVRPARRSVKNRGMTRKYFMTVERCELHHRPKEDGSVWRRWIAGRGFDAEKKRELGGKRWERGMVRVGLVMLDVGGTSVVRHITPLIQCISGCEQLARKS